MEQRLSLNVRVRLSAMMFLQYMMFAVWWVPLASYLDKIGVEGTMKALIVSSMAIGSLVSPVICMFADRHFASQKVLLGLNVACAVLLFAAARIAAPAVLFTVLLAAMFCYMPTWSVTNAVAMANCPGEKFPQIRVFGSIGWVASSVFSIVAMKAWGTGIDGTAIPLYCGAGTAVAAALINLTLPNTPPPAKGQEASVVDALGLRAMGLLKDRNFAVLLVLSGLAMIPFAMYFSLGSQFFANQGFAMVTKTMNWGQFVEMFLMLLVPISLLRFGVKWTIAIGLVAQVVRFVGLWGGGVYNMNIYYVSILIHGVIFGFLVVGGQVYVDKKAPAGLRAQGQGLFALICFGIGMLVGNFFNVKLIDIYTKTADGVKTTNWSSVWIVMIIISVVILGAFVALFRDDTRGAAAAAVAAASGGSV